MRMWLIGGGILGALLLLRGSSDGAVVTPTGGGTKVTWRSSGAPKSRTFANPVTAEEFRQAIAAAGGKDVELLAA